MAMQMRRWGCDGGMTEGKITRVGRSDCGETTVTVRQDSDDGARERMPAARMRRQWARVVRRGTVLEEPGVLREIGQARLLRVTRGVVGYDEGRVHVCGGGKAKEWAVDGWGKTVVCVWLRWMVGEEEEGGMEGIYYFAMQWFSAGGGGWYLGVFSWFLSVWVVSGLWVRAAGRFM